MSEKSIQEMADDAAARCLAEFEASRRVVPPTPEEEIADRLSKARFRESVGDLALLHGVRPSAIRHVVRDAEDVFELRDGALVARNNATDPSDPLSPLTPACWLQQLATTDGYLFTTPGKAH